MGASPFQRPLAPQEKVIGSSCLESERGSIGEGVSRLPQPPDTAPWFMSNCQPQSCFPPGQGRLQWASGEVACPAAVFTVLRRRREPDLGRPGWAAPRDPSRVHTHFPETEHGLPARLAESSCPATRPRRAQLLAGKRHGQLQNAQGPGSQSRAEGRGVQRERGSGVPLPDRFMLCPPRQVCSLPPCPGVFTLPTC